MIVSFKGLDLLNTFKEFFSGEHNFILLTPTNHVWAWIDKLEKNFYCHLLLFEFGNENNYCCIIVQNGVCELKIGFYFICDMFMRTTLGGEDILSIGSLFGISAIIKQMPPCTEELEEHLVFHVLPTYALEQIQCKHSRMVNKINSTSFMCETLAPYYFDKVVSIHKDHTTKTLWYRLRDRCALNQNTNLRNNMMFLWMHWHTLRLLERWGKIPLQCLEPYNAFGWWQHHRHRLYLYHKWASLDPRFFGFYFLWCGLPWLHSNRRWNLIIISWDGWSWDKRGPSNELCSTSSMG